MSLQAIVDFTAEYAGWLAAGAVLSYAIGFTLGPLMILGLPADYFTYRRRQALLAARRRPIPHLLLASAKNVIGLILILTGIVIFFLPGHGLSILLAGLIVMSYPGKFRVERWIVQRPRVLPALNWLRERFGREPLLDPDHGNDG